MNVFDLLRDINDDDSIGKPSRMRSKRMTESIGSLTEAYSVKFGPHDQGEESFDDLNSAIKYINDQVKKYDHSNLILYHDGKELVYLSRMKDRQGQDLGFSISRHNDKSLDFDKSKGLFVVEKEIEDADLTEYFEKLVGGDMIKRSKPAPDIFLETARVLEVEPEDCYVIEDSYNGIRGARAAGMTPFMVPDLLPATEEMEQLAEKIFKDLHEVRMFFAENEKSVSGRKN